MARTLQRKHKGFEVSEKMAALDQQHSELKDLWEKRREEYEHYLDMHHFQRDAEMADGWINAQEGFLLGEDWGGSLDDVEELLKRQDDFEKTLAAQEERFSLLLKETKLEEQERKEKEAEEMKKQKEMVEQERKRREAQRRQDALKKAAEEARKKKEQEERELQRRKEEAEKERIRALELQRKQEDELHKAALLPTTPPPVDVVRDDRELPPPPSIDGTSPPPPKSSYKAPVKDVSKDGYLQRKNELDEGGRKAANRSWKAYYVQLNGTHISFYKDKADFDMFMPACPDINVTHGMCEVAKDYTKKKHTLRLRLPSGAEYLFSAKDDNELLSWVAAINAAIEKSGGSELFPGKLVSPVLDPGEVPSVPLSPPPTFDLGSSMPSSAWTDKPEGSPRLSFDEGDRSRKKGFKLFGRKH